MKTAEEITEQLKKKLDPVNVKQHPYSGFDYIESWFAINEANRIFGHDGWDTEVEYVHTHTSEGEDKYGNTLYEVGYTAKAKVIVHCEKDGARKLFSYKTGTGTGVGFAKKISDAHDSGLKTAESDSEKRALRKFGDPFGLTLYDKGDRSGLGVNETKEQEETLEGLLKMLPDWEKEAWTAEDLNKKASEYLKEIESLTDDQRSLFKNKFAKILLSKKSSEEKNK